MDMYAVPVIDDGDSLLLPHTEQIRPCPSRCSSPTKGADIKAEVDGDRIPVQLLSN